MGEGLYNFMCHILYKSWGILYRPRDFDRFKEDTTFKTSPYVTGLRTNFISFGDIPFPLQDVLANVNKEEICKTRLTHGFECREIMAALNEQLKPAPHVFAADYQVCVTNFDSHLRNSYMS